MKIDKKLNNTCGQILFKSLQKIYGDINYADLGFHEHGGYVDFESKQKISINDFKEIEKIMKKVIASGSKIEVIKKLSKENQFQKEISKENKDIIYIKIGDDFENVSYKDINDNVNKVKFYKLINIGGSYWKNDSKNKQLTRIMYVTFEDKKDLEEYEKFLIEQRESDHRKIGQDMKIFTFDTLVGQGLPIWLPNGQIIKNQIRNFLEKTFSLENFKFLDTPILGSKELYITSGHWDHYKENNFPPISVDNETFILRPMTCPHHMMVYKQEPHSYRELPLYYCENSKLHRYESSGGLIGLERVRAMELFDCHVFCERNDIEKVISKLDNILKVVHKKMGIRIDQIDLSLHDPDDLEKYHNDPKMWKQAETQLRNILKQLDYKFHEMKGEAAFYGPKIDYQVKSNLGKMITISTIQLDFLLPKRFELEYINDKNEKSEPVLIHFGVIGTYERFIATLLSQFKGNIPFWLMPVQIAIIPVNNKFHLEYALEVQKELKENNIRVMLDDSEERMSKKIRECQTSKIPYQLIIGDEEVKNKTISYRKYGEQNTTTSSLKYFLKTISDKD